jgi:hypothetical protein
MRKAGEVVGTNGDAYLARIDRQHDIRSGFADTSWIPGAENRIPVAPVENPISTVVPGFVAYPPELSYPLQPRTNEPAIKARQKGNRRLLHFPGDIERTMWRSGHTDLARLLQNSIRWVAGSNPPVYGSRRWHDRNLRLGDAGRLCRAHSQITRTPPCSADGSGRSIPSVARR